MSITEIDRMSIDEFRDWNAYLTIEPLDPYVENKIAYLFSLIWNANFKNKKESKDFLPKRTRKHTSQQMYNATLKFMADINKYK